MKHTTVLVIEHEAGQSLEGLIDCRNRACKAVEQLGMEVVGAFTKEGDLASALAMRLVTEDDDD